MAKEYKFSMNDQVRITTGVHTDEIGLIVRRSLFAMGYNLYIKGTPGVSKYEESELEELPKNEWIEGWTVSS